jgi:hypothetical protein
MFTHLILSRRQRNKLVYYDQRSTDLRRLHEDRKAGRTYHRYALKIEEFWKEFHTEDLSLSWIWGLLEDIIIEWDVELSDLIRPLCRTGEIEGLAKDVIEEIAHLFAGEALENGTP